MPDVIYDALWNGRASTYGLDIPAAGWPNHRRIHQFSGNITQAHGGFRLDTDRDYPDVRPG